MYINQQLNIYKEKVIFTRDMQGDKIVDSSLLLIVTTTSSKHYIFVYFENRGIKLQHNGLWITFTNIHPQSPPSLLASFPLHLHLIQICFRPLFIGATQAQIERHREAIQPFHETQEQVNMLQINTIFAYNMHNFLSTHFASTLSVGEAQQSVFHIQCANQCFISKQSLSNHFGFSANKQGA